MQRQIAGLIAGGLLLTAAGCGPDRSDEIENQAQVSEESRGPGAGAVAPDIHDPEALSPPQLSETASRGIVEAGEDPSAYTLEQQIRNKLAHVEDLGISEEELEKIDIEVDGRDVRLSGSVPSEQTAQTIEQSVRELALVENVQNDLMASR